MSSDEFSFRVKQVARENGVLVTRFYRSSHVDLGVGEHPIDDGTRSVEVICIENA